MRRAAAGNPGCSVGDASRRGGFRLPWTTKIACDRTVAITTIVGITDCAFGLLVSGRSRCAAGGGDVKPHRDST